MDTNKITKIVVIGGGTGTSVLLRGLREYPVNLTAIVTTADTGGSSGVLRAETGMAPPGDVRQCLVALNEGHSPLISYFNTRFERGNLAGHAFGNLFLAILFQEFKDMQQAVDAAEEMLEAKHHVVPVTLEPTNLVASMKDGTKLEGEAEIVALEGLEQKVEHLQLLPEDATVNPKAKEAIANADYILIGPGNTFASITPALLVNDMAGHIRRSSAKKVYVANLLNERQLSTNYSLADYLAHYDTIFNGPVFDYVLYNTGKIDEATLQELGINEQPVLNGRGKRTETFVEGDLVDHTAYEQNPNDPLNGQRTLVRHNSEMTAGSIMERIVHGERVLHQ
ncbi:MAG: gluconeogenesis factor YvcK family protein [Candidatus Spechtbacterales bacterium]